MPLSDQPALAGLARSTDAPMARRWADRCLSLPLHPRLEPADVDRVIAAVVEWHRE
jgi:dTDP-4-amino-4,6-dideoxygalactose transaminase